MRSNLQHISQSDIIKHPVWRHWYDDGMEYVEAQNKSAVSESSTSSYIVLTEFKLNNKTTLTGFCSPQDFSGLDYIQPVILIGDYHLPLFREGEWSDQEQLDALKKLGVTKGEAFPIIYRSKVSCDGIFKGGTLTDFNTQIN